jgi:hypothetical protein
MDGEGELIYPKDDKFNRVSYNGNFKDGKRSGKGKLVWKDGSKYMGDFEKDLRNGFGVYTYSKEDAEDCYEGHWKDQKKSGKGRLIWKNGTRQEGIFLNDSFILGQTSLRACGPREGCLRPSYNS